MKTNSILRIILWSLVILLLSSILAGGLGFWALIPVQRTASVEEHHVPAYTGPTDPVDPTVSTPGTPDAAPEDGASGTPTDPSAAPEPIPGALTFPAGDVTDITVEWVSGSIFIEPADVSEITVFEDGATEEKYAMVWRLNRGELTILYCENSLRVGLGMGIKGTLSKDLTILVPRDWSGRELELDAASARLNVYDLTFQEVEINTASGTCAFENCAVGSLDVDTASGDITFSGTLRELDCDAASASFIGVLTNTPSRIDMDSASGDLDLTLPEDTGFTVDMDTMRSDFSSDFDTVFRNGCHVCGDGRCRIQMDAMSGDVILRRGTAAGS